MDGLTSLDGGTGSPIGDDPFSLSELMNLESYPDICSPSTSDQALSTFAYPSFQLGHPSWASFIPSTAPPQNDYNDEHLVNVVGCYSNCIDQSTDQMINKQSGFWSNSDDVDGSEINKANGSSSWRDFSDKGMSVIPKCLSGPVSLADRMLSALSLFKESSGGAILAQVWIPIKHGDEYLLSTSEQPYLLDQMLAGYREVSRGFTFSAKEAPGSFPGLPGRVYISRMPEWTTNVVYYSRNEYLRVNYALDHEVRGSLALPVFDLSDQSCCAVLELVTTKEKPNFDPEMEIVRQALQAVNLRTAKPHSHQQSLTKNQRAAFTEIMDVLRATCHAHMLPLALTWIPFGYESAGEGNSNPWTRSMLQIQESACYVNDRNMHGFVHACAEHDLEEGQAIAGKALKSNHPFFAPDVKGYDVREYPLAHHARKFGLQAAVAIRLRSTYTGDDDYVLEFFLPVNCKGSAEQQLLLDNLSSTMQTICGSLRTVSDTAVVGSSATKTDNCKGEGLIFSSTSVSRKHSQPVRPTNKLTSSDKVALQTQNVRCNESVSAQHDQATTATRRLVEKKRTMAEKNISLSVLQQYFAGSLKDAAKSIGVCPTTLKRICRQHGISRWPSRKINKFNRSLQKIQTVIDSVQGVEGAIKYNPVSGNLVATVTSSAVHCTSHQNENSGKIKQSDAYKGVADKGGCVPLVDCNNISKFASLDRGLSQHYELKGIHSKDSPPGSDKEISLHCAQGNWGASSSSMEAADELDKGIAGNEDIEGVIVEQNHPSSSGTTDSSNGSSSSNPAFERSSEKTDCMKALGSFVTVKATYKDDTVRFKFLPAMGCLQLFEEVGKRFNLGTETFRLKYMDDEGEWVMLMSDADLEECVEVLQSLNSCSVKILVRDHRCSVGSSVSSNYLS